MRNLRGLSAMRAKFNAKAQRRNPALVTERGATQSRSAAQIRKAFVTLTLGFSRTEQAS
jgi:hypothetical protein